MSLPGRVTKYAHERQIAMHAVEKAAQLCSKVFQHLVHGQTVTKKDASPVTVADFGSQALINDILSSHFPNDPIVGKKRDWEKVLYDTLSGVPWRLLICFFLTVQQAKKTPRT